MAASAVSSKMGSGSRLGVREALSALVVVLAAVAAGGGLFIAGLYRDPVAFVPVLQGQDLVTLMTLPVLVAAMLFARGGSVRAVAVWVGVLGYLLYTYAGAAVGYAINGFTLIYIALFSLCVSSLFSVVSGIDFAAFRASFDVSTPRKPVAAFLVLIAAMLTALEIGENVGFITTGAIPSMIVRSGGVTSFVYAFDLGFVVPLSVMAAVALIRQVPWSHLLAGVILIKAATMGLALLSMNWFAVRSGTGSDGLEAMYAVIVLGGLGLSFWFLRHCRG